MAVIASCAFGIEMEEADYSDNMFLRKCREIFNRVGAVPFLSIMSLSSTYRLRYSTIFRFITSIRTESYN